MTTRTSERGAEMRRGLSTASVTAPSTNAPEIRRDRVDVDLCEHGTLLPWTCEVGGDARGATRPCASQLGPW
jgi:hypothetical protein